MVLVYSMNICPMQTKVRVTKVKGRMFTEYTTATLFIIMIDIMVMHCVGVSIHNNAMYVVYYALWITTSWI